MIFKRFLISSILRIAAIALILALLVYLVLETELFVTTLFLVALLVYQIRSLYSLVSRTNRGLTRFLQSIKYSDFTQNYKADFQDAGFRELANEYEKVLDRFRRIRQEREENHQYLQTVVQHVGVGLIAYSSDGAVEMVNNAFRRLLQVPAPKEISRLESVSPELVKCLEEIVAGENRLVKVSVQRRRLLLSVYATSFILHQTAYRLVALQDIHEEMEEQEMQAWHNLIRVLTHEIMNSMTPIASLAGTANGMVKNLDIDNETARDLNDALGTIEKRSQGLISFIDDYRQLTRIPLPQFQRVKVSEIFGRVTQMVQENCQRAGIAFSIAVKPDDMSLTIDPGQIEQVLLNLVKNASEALAGQDNGTIQLTAGLDENSSPVLAVADNGPGIDPDILENIFIPFYTTKSEGNGIGLSLSKEIVRRHKGRLEVESTPGDGAVFKLYL